MEEECSARMPDVVLWMLPACSFRQGRNLDLQVCAPSGTPLLCKLKVDRMSAWRTGRQPALPRFCARLSRMLPVEHNDLINEKILAISEDKIEGFVRQPFQEIADRVGVP